MNEQEKKRQELLDELAKRFRDSANNLKSVARRIDKAARTHDRMQKRMDAANAKLRAHLDEEASTIPWTYLEYVEFDSAEEFQKFKHMDRITDEEISTIDWNNLCNDLLRA